MSRKLQESVRKRKGPNGEKGKKEGHVCEKGGVGKRKRGKGREKKKAKGVLEGKRLKGKNRKGVGTRQWEQVPMCQDEKCQGKSKGKDLREKGASRRARTCDPQLRRLMLFRLS